MEIDTSLIKLPEVRRDGPMSVEQALFSRRSFREFKRESLTLQEITQLLWSADGVTDVRNYRTAPSAGALFPLEVYLVAGQVTGIPPGIYRYGPRRHVLEQRVPGDRREDLCQAALGQDAIRRAPAILAFFAIYDRTMKKYGERGMRYVHMEVGHAAQNISLQAVALDIGAVVIGAFRDEKVKKIMNCETDQYPLYLIPVGR